MSPSVDGTRTSFLNRTDHNLEFLRLNVPNSQWSTGSVREDFEKNGVFQFPLSTITVRWQLRKNVQGYDISSLNYMLSNFGEIAHIKKISPNTAVVVFEDIVGACQAMQAKHVGEPYNKIHCSWWHRSMEQKLFYPSSRGLRTKVNNTACYHTRLPTLTPQMMRVRDLSRYMQMEKKNSHLHPTSRSLKKVSDDVNPAYHSQLGTKIDLITPNIRRNLPERIVRFGDNDTIPASVLERCDYLSPREDPPNSLAQSPRKQLIYE